MITSMTLSVDNIVFTKDELPEGIAFGGVHVLSKKRMTGSHLFTQSFGYEDDEISWSGHFLYEGSLTRAQSLDALRRSGKTVQFTCGTISKKGIVTKFKYTIKSMVEIDYEISIQPLDFTNVGSFLEGDSSIPGYNYTRAHVENGSPSVATPANAGTVDDGFTYIVRQGDCLYDISAYFYGKGELWPLIYEANRKVIKNPTEIYPGQTFKILAPRAR